MISGSVIAPPSIRLDEDATILRTGKISLFFNETEDFQLLPTALVSV